MGRFEPIFSVYFSKSVNIIDSLDKKENDMTDQTKFEEMLEKLVNEDRDGAEALFHEIVVEKSREIYTNILDEADEEVEETTDEEVEEAADEEVEEAKTPKSASETMREYVEKISEPSNQEGADNKKSTVAGKNDMGGTASNLNQGKDGGHPEAGAGSTVQGSALSDTSAKEDNAGNVNVPGGKASKSMKSQPGHGAEKKGKPENAANKKSMTGS